MKTSKRRVFSRELLDDLDVHLERLCAEFEHLSYKKSGSTCEQPVSHYMTGDAERLKEIFALVLRTVGDFKPAEAARFRISLAICQDGDSDCRAVMEVAAEDDRSSVVALITALHFAKQTKQGSKRPARTVKADIESCGGLIWMAPPRNPLSARPIDLACQIQIPLPLRELGH